MKLALPLLALFLSLSLAAAPAKKPKMAASSAPQPSATARENTQKEEEVFAQTLEKLADVKKKVPQASSPAERRLFLDQILHYYGFLPLTTDLAGDAKSHAENALKEAAAHHGQGYGNEIHYGNIILGRLALSRGDAVTAKTYLQKAGQSPGSPTLNSFGPNLMLARELLRKGEKKAVLDYLSACLKFWQTENKTFQRKHVNAWVKSIEKGEMPDFGVRLYR